MRQHTLPKPLLPDFDTLRPSCPAVSVVEPCARPSRRPALSIVATFTALLDHDGAIEGTVTDPTGAVLPGVTITAASDALMALRTTLSAADGSYLLSALPPGTYQLLYVLSGFASASRESPPLLWITPGRSG